ncbi:chaplin family protein [Streptomyces sp. NPDC003011]
MRQTLSRGMIAAAAATSVLSLCGSPALADSQADGAAKNSPGAVSGNDVQVPVEVPLNACGNTIDVVAALNPTFGNSCANESDGPERGSHGESGDDDSGHGSGHDSGYDSGHGSGHDSGYDSGHGSGHDPEYDSAYDSGHGYGDGTDDSSGSSAHGWTEGSPGVGSGNDVQAPVEVPVNACGNTADVVAALNPAFGNSCAEEDGPGGYGDTPPTTPPHTPPPGGEHTPPAGGDETPPPPGGDGGHTPPVGDEYVPSPAGGGHEAPTLAQTGDEAVLGASAMSAALILGGAVLYRRGRAASRR